MSRRGQSSLEYLLTYGWAFLVILVTVGALVYFGVLSPGKWVPEKCEFGTQLECVDWRILDGDAQDDEISLFLRNSFGKDIVISDGKVITDDGEEGSLDESSYHIKAGNTTEVVINDISGDTMQPRQKTRLILELTVQRDDGSGSPTTTKHTIRGSVYAEVQK